MSSPSITPTPASTRQGCREFADVFQHPLLEEPPTASAPSDQQREYSMLTRRAETLCHACPLMSQCLYNAVVKHDVAGYAGGTTARQRLEIRRRLGVVVDPEDFDTLAGITEGNRHVDHDEVVRLRQANPHETLETLARRLGCSLSTVKRHLRRHRNETHRPHVQPSPRPSLPEVMAAFRAVVTPGSLRRAA